MKALIVIGYHKKDSFNYGIAHTIRKEYESFEKPCTVIDLYDDEFHAAFHAEKNEKLIKRYKKLIKEATHIYFVSPVWWFRCTSMLEGFFDQLFVPGFAYKFRAITKTYGVPEPLLRDKTVYTYLTHGAPALPVHTLYINSVKWRLQLGVFSFVFGWFRPTIRQFFSVPFCSDQKREKMLKIVRKDVEMEVGKWTKDDWFSDLPWHS